MSQVKRSQKTTDFAVITRERSFIRNGRDQTKRRSATMASLKTLKPTMEIYRPPNVRTDLPPKLNVHAKEFTMDLQPSRSSGNLVTFDPANLQLQHSKSSGNLLRHPLYPMMPLPLIHPNLPRLIYANDILPQPIFTGHNSPQTTVQTNLKRSKSLGANDTQQLLAQMKSLAMDELDLGIFTEDTRANIKLAIDDPNQLPSRLLMDLVATLMGRVVDGMRYAEAVAKLCIAIIAKEKNQTFLESLLNTCQQWYQERDKMLRGLKAGDGTKFSAFMWFLVEMCGQLKRYQFKEQFETMQPDRVLLSVLCKCCQACVSLPIRCLAETECLFFVLTSIGRELETELPQQLEQLLASVRDGFLTSNPAVRRTLLQLIELHASNWQLPGSSVLYYYPRIK